MVRSFAGSRSGSGGGARVAAGCGTGLGLIAFLVGDGLGLFELLGMMGGGDECAYGRFRRGLMSGAGIHLGNSFGQGSLSPSCYRNVLWIFWLMHSEVCWQILCHLTS